MVLPPEYFAHRVLPAAGHAILAFLTTRDAVELRSCGTDCLAAVAAHKWSDADTLIFRDVAGWHTCFPRATAANISGTYDEPNTWVTDADFVHLAGLRELNMAWCTGVTDAALVHLRGIHELDMQGCAQVAGAGFVHLRGIHTLNISCCKSITDAAFPHLAGIHTLSMGKCWQ
jgi:hypothetical protein